ncbi:serine protease [uncultured Thermomonospora sp.]|uniref:trypsin-like serine peptidase n=1 Tax=uncultured Thermomonospora sp. TaxID=671175 RepID=UPI000DB5FAF7|nr:hypothetical protein [uncultured Thermomonospora sp.]PZM89057.1 MAG: hypothetical protein DIU79_15945 [Actinomycetota bacterium]
MRPPTRTAAGLIAMATAMTLLLPGTATAATPETAATAAPSPFQAISHPAGDVSAASVLNYWTPERMAKAKPLDRSLNGPAAGPDVTANAVTNAKIRPNPKTKLNRTTGKLFLVQDGYDGYCSATVTTAGNKRSVWTAGHCVHSGRGGDWSTYGLFVPAYHNGKAPFQRWVVDRWVTTYGWISNPTPQAFAYDIAAFTVKNKPKNKKGKRKLQQVVGGKPVKIKPARKLGILNLGYPHLFLPSGKPTNTRKMYYCQGPSTPYNIAGKGWPVGLATRCTMGNGASGGGWLHKYGKTWYIVGLNSAHHRHNKITFSPYHGPAARSVLKTVRSFK